ncbi:MAG: sortase [Gaiellaceae bacterium]
MPRFARIVGTLLIAVGVLMLAWVVVVWRWEDPFTALYTHVEQTRLSHRYDKRAAAFEPHLSGDLAAVERQVAREAGDYRRSLHVGDPVGRLRIGRIGLNMVVVQGTDHDTLKKGPGHYLGSGLPGEGRLVYVAGHRTTYLAPFAYINDIRAGDFIRFELPYGTFSYRVVAHYVVADNEVSVLRNRGRELLRLQACHPRFFATNRYIVDAKLVAVAPAGGASYSPLPKSAAT